MKKNNYLILLLSLFSLVTLYGQGETSNWYFGQGAGLRFNNNGSVTALTNGKLTTVEGCTSISDSDGNLLAYTDGITVYNKNHQIVLNGNGLFGDPSSTQSAIIVPKPEDPNIYFIFTVDTSINENDPDYGLNYSILDISLNGGNGEIIQKNINLLQDSTEKITGVIKDCFDQSIWVITLASPNGSPDFYNTYHCFEVNAAGVNTNAVLNTFPNLTIGDPRGYLKLSSDGKKMVSANVSDGVYLYDFEAQTGLLSNQIPLTIPGGYSNQAYGVEFSTEGQYLYVNTFTNEDVSQSLLIQYDLNEPDISSSAVIIDERAAYRGALQMAENGKIYRANPNSYTEGIPYLSVLNNPSEKGLAVNYAHNAVSLNGKNVMQGLPPFIQSFFNKTDLIKNPDGTSSASLTICEGDSFILETENIPGATYEWEKDGSPITNPDNYFLDITNATLNQAGKYRLEITSADPKVCPIIGESTIIVSSVPPNGTLTIVQCDIDSENSTDGITTINLEQAYLFENNAREFIFSFYENATDLANDIAINNPIGYTNTQPLNQTIYYKASSARGCESEGLVEITVQPTTVSVHPQSPFYACDTNANDLLEEGTFDLDEIKRTNYPNLDATFYSSLTDASLEQNAISGMFLTASTTVYVRLENSNECQGVDEIGLVVNPTPTFTFPEIHYLCTDGNDLRLNAPSGYDIYRWIKVDGSNETEISNSAMIAINEIGTYSLELGYEYRTTKNTVTVCSNRANFNVIPSNIALIENIEIKDLSENNTIEIITSGDGSYEFSINGINYQDSPKFFDLLPGFVTVYVQDKYGCGIREEKIAIIGYPKFFTPNGDGAHDNWQIIGVDAIFQPNSIISIFDRYGTLVASISPKNSGWNGNFNGQPLPAADYWFKVALEDGRIFKGHFALKR